MLFKLSRSHFRIFQLPKLFALQFNRSAASKFKDNQSLTVLTDDGKLIVSWHPAQDFPYECSKPLPEMKPEVAEGDSLLKVQYRLVEANRDYKENQYGLQKRLDLMALTYTNKHIWFPKSKRRLLRYAKNAVPNDRDGL